MNIFIHNNIEDTDELRKISIVSYLENQGFMPAKPKNSRGELMYLSPFRNETKPSFSVNTEKNLWYDFGNGNGGDIFNLVMKMWDVDFAAAKIILRKGAYKQMFYRPVDTCLERQHPSPFTDIKVSPLTSSYFLDYCAKRCIDLDVARAECRQVDYRLYGNMNSAIGFENDKGGWELRSPVTKIGTSKAISTRKRQEGNKTVCVFEGFFDYLSFLTMMETDQRHRCDFIVLNSVGMTRKAIPVLKGYSHVRCYLDNDAAGRNAFEIIRQTIIGADDRSSFYLPYNDVNEYLCAKDGG